MCAHTQAQSQSYILKTKLWKETETQGLTEGYLWTSQSTLWFVFRLKVESYFVVEWFHSSAF